MGIVIAFIGFNFYIAKSNDHMKRFILCAILIPLAAGRPGFNQADPILKNDPISTNLVEVRSGEWPMILERTIDRPDTTYSLQFRDQQVINGIVLDTLPFPNLQQLKYFGKALSALKTGNNGDIAKFKDYSVKRADKKGEGTWYLLRYQWGLTDFQQPEADIMIRTIRSL